MKCFLLVFFTFLIFTISLSAQNEADLLYNELSNLKIKQQYGQAIVLLNRLLENNPNDPNLYINRAEILEFQNKPDEVIADINTAINLNPSDATFYIVRARFLNSKGDNKAVLKDVQTAVSLAPNKATILKDGVALLSFGKQYKEIIKLTDSYIARGTSSAWYLNCLAYKLRSENKFALQDYVGALKDSIQSIDSIEFTGDVWKDMSASIEIGNLEQTNVIDPVTRHYLRNDKRIFEYYNQIFDVLDKKIVLFAEQSYRLFIMKGKPGNINPEDLYAYQDSTAASGVIKFRMLMADCADLYAQKGQPEKGLELYDKIIKIRPQRIGYVYRANFFIYLKKYQNAIDDLTSINSKQEKPFSDILFKRGDVYILMKEFDKAIADYETVKSLYKSSEDAADQHIAEARKKQAENDNNLK